MKSLPSPIKLPVIFEEKTRFSFKARQHFVFIYGIEIILRFQIALKVHILFMLWGQGIQKFRKRPFW